MDYADSVDFIRHESFAAFDSERKSNGVRLLTMTTRGDALLHKFRFHCSDVIMLGQESAGVPDDVLRASDHQIRIPMARGVRSLNMHVAAALALFEASRQTKGLNDGNDAD